MKRNNFGKARCCMSNFWKGRNVFITGGDGFIGSWLTKALVEKGANVICLIRDIAQHGGLTLHKLNNSVEMVFGSVTDYALMQRVLNEKKVDTCFHLAAQAIVRVANESPLSTFESNIKGTWVLLEACRNYKNISRIIAASSDKAYGKHDKLPYSEEFSLLPIHPYEASKACSDILVRSYAQTYDLPVAVTRCANTYGGGDLNFDRIVPETIKHILFGEPILIRSNGKFKREFFYVKDAAKAYLVMGEKLEELGLKGEAFNFGTDQPVVILDLVRKIVEISGKHDTEIKILNEAKAEIKDQFLSNKKARSVLNWSPEYDLDRGLRETYEWYKDHFGK